MNALLSPTPSEGSRTALGVLITLVIIAGVSAALATHELAHLFDLLRGDG